MFETYNTSGFDLYQPFSEIDQWVLDPKSSQAMHGNLKEVVNFMIDKLDFYGYDIELALNLLANNIQNDDNAIHFGVNKTPIFTFNQETKYGKRAS